MLSKHRLAKTNGCSAPLAPSWKGKVIAIEIYCMDEANRELCFTHAVKLIIEQKVEIHLEVEETDSGENDETGWGCRVHDCYICD